jgi:hypothetical protein
MPWVAACSSGRCPLDSTVSASMQQQQHYSSSTASYSLREGQGLDRREGAAMQLPKLSESDLLCRGGQHPVQHPVFQMSLSDSSAMHQYTLACTHCQTLLGSWASRSFHT